MRSRSKKPTINAVIESEFNHPHRRPLTETLIRSNGLQIHSLDPKDKDYAEEKELLDRMFVRIGTNDYGHPIWRQPSRTERRRAGVYQRKLKVNGCAAPTPLPTVVA